ncbi:MAG: hypothetical protein ACE5E5_07905, partial [Phycisphaerae bacterium]
VVVHTPNDANCDNGLFCDGSETCDATLDCQAGTPPALSDGVACTDDTCDEALNVVVHTPNDANCDNGLFCDGSETCDAVLDCQIGAAPCAVSCEHCVEASATCEWCIFDLDVSGVIGTGDFALFAACFGNCYLPGDPCLESDFDNLDDCVGTGDYAAFVGCFGQVCGDCPNCSGPLGGSGGNGGSPGGTSKPFAALVSLVAVAAPSPVDMSDHLPTSLQTVDARQTFFLELWASRGFAASGTGLAAVFADMTYDPLLIAAGGIVPGDLFSNLAGGQVDHTAGQVHAMGGLARLGESTLGVDGMWVRVARLRVSARRPGTATVSLASSGSIHGVSVAGQFGNVALGDISFSGVSVSVEAPPRPSLHRPGGGRKGQP